MGLSSFPPEIYSSIVDCIDADDRVTLKQVCLVSRAFRSLAQPRLFGYTDLCKMSEVGLSAIPRLLRSLQNPDLAGAVRHIRHCEGHTHTERHQEIRLAQLLEPCKNLHAITFTPAGFGFVTVKQLQARDELIDCLESLPRLALMAIADPGHPSSSRHRLASEEYSFDDVWDAAQTFGRLSALGALDVDFSICNGAVPDSPRTLPRHMRTLTASIQAMQNPVSESIIVRHRKNLVYKRLRLSFTGDFGGFRSLLSVLCEETASLELISCDFTSGITNLSDQALLDAPPSLKALRLSRDIKYYDWKYLLHCLPCTVEDLYIEKLSHRIVKSLITVLERMKENPTKLVRLHIPSSGLRHIDYDSGESYYVYGRPGIEGYIEGYCKVWGETVKDRLKYARNGGAELDNLCAELGITVYPHGFYEAFGGEPTFRLKRSGNLMR